VLAFNGVRTELDLIMVAEAPLIVRSVSKISLIHEGLLTVQLFAHQENIENIQF